MVWVRREDLVRRVILTPARVEILVHLATAVRPADRDKIPATAWGSHGQKAVEATRRQIDIDMEVGGQVLRSIETVGAVSMGAA